jgi:hypothetical protein
LERVPVDKIRRCIWQSGIGKNPSMLTLGTKLRHERQIS